MALVSKLGFLSMNYKHIASNEPLANQLVNCHKLANPWPTLRDFCKPRKDYIASLKETFHSYSHQNGINWLFMAHSYVANNLRSPRTNRWLHH